jgi:maleylacetoacetate isomerase
MIKLYGYWRSTAAYRVRLALNIKQISYSQVSVHLVKDGGEQHSPEYLHLNPQALVPTLVDDGIVIGQSIAILEYLEEKYPRVSLLPESLAQKAVVRQLCQIIASDLHPLNNLRVLKYLSNELNISDQNKTSWYHHWLHAGFSAFEKIVSDFQAEGDYCLGRELTMADTCLIPQLYNANRFDFPLDEFPRIKQINDNCLKLVRFRDAIPEHQPDAV